MITPPPAAATPSSSPSPASRPLSGGGAAYRLIAVAGLIGMLAVLIGAFGAHGLPDFLARQHALEGAELDKRLDQFDVGVQYHLVHSAALLAVCCLPGFSRRTIAWVAGGMILGIVLFSGSLYLLVATNTPWLGAITPLGGTSWIVAWSLLAIAAWRAGGRSPG